MERDEKIQLILDMQEHPEQFSEQALQAMLDDPEVRQLMEATTQLKQAMKTEDGKTAEYDVDAEWQRFAQAHLTERKPRRGWLKTAATFIGILMLSGIALAAIYSLTPSSSSVGEGSNYSAADSADNHITPLTTARVADGEAPVRYNEATLEQILTEMADYYRLTLNWKNEEVKTLRLFFIWNRQLSVSESTRQLNNFERFHLELNDSIITVE